MMETCKQENFQTHVIKHACWCFWILVWDWQSFFHWTGRMLMQSRAWFWFAQEKAENRVMYILETSRVKFFEDMSRIARTTILPFGWLGLGRD
jgi:hypothetical protein